MVNNYIETTVKIVLLFFTSLSFAQEYLNPIQKTSFGLHNHTNRDISYHSLTDNLGSIYSIGTTERDSSFTDIIASKFDVNLNLIWQKRYSLDTGLSYDVPLVSYLDSYNNLLIIGRSSFKQSSGNGLIFIVKYNINGEEIWQRTIGNIDGSDYYDYAYFNSSFEDDTLRITYIPIKWDESGGNGTSEVKFLKMDNEGNISEEFIASVLNNGLNSIYENGIHYTLIRKDNDTGYSDYYISKIGHGINESYLLNSQSNFVQENFTQVLEQIQLRVDSDGNLYLIKPFSQDYHGSSLSYTRINNLGEIEYSKNTSSNHNLLGSYVDIDNRLVMVYEDSSISKIIKKKVDEFGDDLEVLELNYNNLSGSRFNDDKSIFLVDENNLISLYSKSLSFVNSFNYSSSFQLSDITNLNDSDILVSGTSYEKMYPNSDFNTQNNIVLEKLSPDQILNTYSFSGEGTSKAFQQKLLIDNNDNYIVISQEKMGPDNWSIGGSRAPINKSINKYDSNFNLLWKMEFSNELIGYDNALIDLENNIYINTGLYGFGAEGYELIKISPQGNILFQKASFQNSTMYFDQNYNVNVVSFPTRNDLTFDDDTTIYTFDAISGGLLESKLYEGLQFIDNYKSQNGDFYIYMYTGPNSYGDTSPRIDVYKNLSLDFSINIAVTGTYGAAGSFDIAENGDLFFTSSWGQINEKFHKISLSGSYNYINIENEISELKILNNGKIFTIEKISSEKGKIQVYNDNLTLFSNGSDVVYDHPEILEVNGYIWLNTHSYYGDVVEVFNQNNVKVDEFKIASSLNYSVFDSNKDIILTGQFGNQIYIFHEYSWARGLLYKYKYEGPQDSDGDGIGDNIDLCNNTPAGETVDSNGCSETQKDDDGDEIMNNVDQCPDTPAGEIVDLNGCSESQKDDDGDGVMNNTDECPNTVLIDLVNSKGCFELLPNNFSIKSIAETCPDKNNGKIIISAIKNLNYITTINGVDYDFTNTLTIDNLNPGAYNFCIKVPLENFEQCYHVDLEEGITISGKSSVKSGKVSIDIEAGTAPFNVSKNGVIQFYSNASSFSVDALYGDLIEVTTSKSCEGKLSKMVGTFDKVIATPNPTINDFEILLPILNREVTIELYSIQSQLISTSKYKETNGKVSISLKDHPNGIYFVKVYLDEPITLKIIKQ